MKKSEPPNLIEGEGLRLERFHPDQAAALYEAIEANRARLEVFLPWVPLVQSVDDQEGALRRAKQQWEAGSEFSYVIRDSSSGAIHGGIGVHNLAWDNDAAELGYWISEDAEGRGLVSRAVGLLERALFSLGFHRLEIRCRADNLRSARVAERCDYQLEGRLRENTLHAGKYCDTLIFGKLRGEADCSPADSTVESD